MATTTALEKALKALLKEGFNKEEIGALVTSMLERYTRKPKKSSTRARLRSNKIELPDTELELRRVLKSSHPDTSDLPDVETYQAAVAKLKTLKRNRK